MLLAWAPPTGAQGTFAAVELYQTNGWGQNRDGRRGSAMAQWEGHVGSADLRLSAQAYIASFHSAGVVRDDDYRAGRIGFYDTYDPKQGDDAQRYSVSAEVSNHTDHMAFRNQLFGIVRPITFRENFTGFLLDPQTPFESPHEQRGDLMSLHVMEETVGLRGSARLHGQVLKQEQELEFGYYARGDFVDSTQQRIEAATGHPYRTDYDLSSTLGDIGLYADANLRFTRWLALRGGARGDLLTYDVNNKCAVPITTGVSHPSMPVDNVSCLSQEDMGQYREPNQRVSTVSGAVMPRGSIILGPWKGFGASVSAGQGVRSIDPQYITQDAKTPFATIDNYEGGLQLNRRFLDSMDLSVKTTVFYTHLDHDLIFDPTAGRSTLGGATTRIGSASSARFTGSFWDLAANLTYTSAKYDDTHLLVPYVPDLVFRADGALFGDLPWWKEKLRGHLLRARLGAGFSYVGPRPLPYGARSDTIATLDARASLGWRWIDFEFSASNLTGLKYRLGEYDYVSDFHTTPNPTLVPTRAFTAGAPREMFFSIRLNYGGRS
jgi:iron complex outermembrane receptor protein